MNSGTKRLHNKTFNGKHLFPLITHAVAFSVPCDLKASALELSKRQNFLYRNRFLGKIKRKIKKKALLMPEEVSYEEVKHIRHFPERKELELN